MLDCPDCTVITATDGSGYTAAAIKQCAAHRTATQRRIAAARAANPEIDAVQRMAAAARSRAAAQTG